MQKRKNNFILIDKLHGISSFQFIKKFKKEYEKIGHSGTLDPYCTGLLIVGTNRATKFFQFLPKNKQYIFEIEFGYETDSYDLDGKIINKNNIFPNRTQIEENIKNFIGKQEQIPNKFSAIKINGKRAYDLARNNIDFEMKKRLIEIYDLKLLDFYENKAKFLVDCSEGTYIRTLAKNFCEKLNTIGCVVFLRRTKSNGFELNNDKEMEFIDLNCFEKFYPKILLSEEKIQKLNCGMKFEIYDNNLDGIFSVFDKENDFKGLVKSCGGIIFPACMLLD